MVPLGPAPPVPRRSGLASRPLAFAGRPGRPRTSSRRLCHCSQLVQVATPPMVRQAHDHGNGQKRGVSPAGGAPGRALAPSVETGRPTIGRPSRNRSRSSRRPPAEAYRRAGSLRRHFRQIVSRSRGRPGRSDRGATGSASSTRRKRLGVGLAAERRPAGQDLVEGRPQARRRRSRARPRSSGPRPARGPCNGAYPSGRRSASRRRPPR